MTAERALPDANATARRWLSVHVFLGDPVEAERYLRERLEPVVQRWRASGALERWFFIRYWEGGPHLRIRLCGPVAQDEGRVLATFAEDIASFSTANPPTREDYYRAHPFDGQPVAIDALPWFAEGTVARIDYEPETLRYGGADTMAANEDLFCLSSRIALNVCRVTEGNRTGRLSAAFALMATAILACGESMVDVGAYFERYGALWAARTGLASLPPQAASAEQLAMLRQLQAEAAGAGQGRSLYAAWAAGVRELAAQLRRAHAAGRLGVPFTGEATVGDAMCRRAVLDIVGSQIHMLNNRLGVPPAGEFLLAGSLARAAHALERQGEVA
jgi:thiopeptide-type bacteriocin biosynthesis protein